MEASFWRQEARRALLAALAEARALGLDPSQTLALVDHRYPFGAREHWPYRVWLEERRRLALQRPGKPRRPPPPVSEAQAAFWEARGGAGESG